MYEVTSNTNWPRNDLNDLKMTSKWINQKFFIGETARLICNARGVPNVTFHWARGSGGQRLSLGSKFQVKNAQVDPLNFRSELLIHNVSSVDYGGYECIARNSEGTTHSTIDLDVKSRPGKSHVTC